MALPNVSIQLQNGGLGLVPRADDRVMGLIVNGYTDTAAPFVVYSYSDFVSKVANLTGAATDTLNAVIAQQVQDFYTEAGDGAELWILTVLPETSLTNVFLNDADALMQVSGGRVNVVGVHRASLTEPGTITRTGGMDSDVIAGLPTVQQWAVNQASAHTPVRVILDGFHLDIDTSTIADLTQYSDNRVGICIGARTAGAVHAAIGLLLGRIAAIPVNQNIGRVKTGAVAVPTGYLTNGLAVNTLSAGAQGAIHDKGYIFLRTFTGKAGYYWNDDPMATAVTDDYHSLSNGRVIDKVSRLAYATYLEELNDTVLVDAVTGKIIPATLKYYQGKIQRAIDLTMTTAGEISGVTAFVDPAQDILGTSMLMVDVRITPTGTNRAILVRLGLYNPLA